MEYFSCLVMPFQVNNRLGRVFVLLINQFKERCTENRKNIKKGRESEKLEKERERERESERESEREREREREREGKRERERYTVRYKEERGIKRYKEKKDTYKLRKIILHIKILLLILQHIELVKLKS